MLQLLQVAASSPTSRELARDGSNLKPPHGAVAAEQEEREKEKKPLLGERGSNDRREEDSRADQQDDDVPTQRFVADRSHEERRVRTW
jgi:hypothetical protein